MNSCVESRLFCLLPALWLLAACTASAPELPYAAFVDADELPDVFLAELPGVRAKRFVSDAGTRSGSYRVDLPPDWQGTSGASPGKSLEIFVVAGELALADVTLREGGYAYLPPGTLGFNLRSDSGARVLYFIDDVADNAVIRTPLIQDSTLLGWQALDIGLDTKVLRADPGSGARTWLLKVMPDAAIFWEESSAVREGYLVAGSYTHAECLQGEAIVGEYSPGGYFYRPPQTINGGPDAGTADYAVWLLRESTRTATTILDACISTEIID